ncbi:adhesion G-protein coupled receptor F1-like [Pyxicephalus adspersus]|uniref:adhesion G-protein coupled receptor F1-like n=1 Tax=Pyxicephalus adspersus TaxID=30357 RepID=UPI003B5B1EF7
MVAPGTGQVVFYISADDYENFHGEDYVHAHWIHNERPHDIFLTYKSTVLNKSSTIYSWCPNNNITHNKRPVCNNKSFITTNHKCDIGIDLDWYTYHSNCFHTKYNPSTILKFFARNQLNSGGLDVIESLWSYTTGHSDGFQETEIPLVLYILGNITKKAQLSNLKFNVITVEKVLSIADQLMTNISSLEPSVSLEYNFGPELLECLEGIFSVMSVTYQPLSKAYKNFDFFCSVSSCKDLEDNRILHLDSSKSVSLKNETNNFSSGCYINLLFMSYSPKNYSFTSLYYSNTTDPNSYFLASEIQIYVMKINNDIYHMANINTTFTCDNRTYDQSAVCVFWDFRSNKWSSQGCVTQVVNGSTYCKCGHLTSFAVLMSNSVPADTVDSVILDYMTRIGLIISIVSLVVCIMIQAILLKHSMKMAAQYRHIAILHMSVFLLIGMISFLASSFINHSVQDQLCIALTFCSHFSLVSFFCWTLVQGLYLASRLLFVFHHVTKTELVSVSVVLGYICPVAIAVGTFLFFFPKNYRREKACWLDGTSGANLAFNIPVMVTMFINFIVLAVVIQKLLRPSISEGKSEDEEVVKKMAKAVLFCTPQFGLTWAIGIPLYTISAAQNTTVLQYIFVILNPLQYDFQSSS